MMMMMTTEMMLKIMKIKCNNPEVSFKSLATQLLLRKQTAKK